MINQNVILIGFMGVGKTSLGKKLARKLNIDFVDTDEIIEERQQKSIVQIFEESGEDHFRSLEAELIDAFIKEKNKSEPKVISVGGGLPVFNGLAEKLNNLGITIYLHRPAKELFNRLVNAKEQRPLVKSLSQENLMHYIERTLTERERYYTKAKLILERNQQDVKQVMEILKSNYTK